MREEYVSEETAPAPLRSVPHQLEQLALEAKQLLSALELLEVKAEPILQPTTAGSDVADVSVMLPCKLAAELAEVRNTLAICYELLTSVINRLEI